MEMYVTVTIIEWDLSTDTEKPQRKDTQGFYSPVWACISPAAGGMRTAELSVMSSKLDHMWPHNPPPDVFEDLQVLWWKSNISQQQLQLLRCDGWTHHCYFWYWPPLCIFLCSYRYLQIIRILMEKKQWKLGRRRNVDLFCVCK